MIVIGEKLNSTLKAIRPAMEARDSETIRELARQQVAAGATHLDVNAGMFLKEEREILTWLVETVSEVTDVPLVLDSPSPEALEAGLKVHRNGRPVINSITGETERWEAVLPLVTKYDAGVIALCMDDRGMPEDVDGRVDIAHTMIRGLTQAGVQPGDIYIDPLVRPVSTGSHYGVVAIETIRRVKADHPDVHIACGLSNVSYGIPGRKRMNQAFLVAAMAAGMDGAILDPLDTDLMDLVCATEALLGRDAYCMNYLKRHRAGQQASGPVNG